MSENSGVENIQEGIILMNLQGEIEYVNSMVEEMLIFTQEELAGQPISDLVVGYDVGKEWDTIVNTIKGGHPYEFPPLKMLKRNGRTTTARMRGFSLKRPADDESWIVFYVQDISKEINTTIELEQRNRELTRENSMLLKESSNFKRISELKTKFLGIASHELKTPLTSIKGYSEILLDTMSDQLNDEVERMVSRISRAADKLHNVVNDMLDVTRIEQNRLRLRPEDLNLKAILEECIEELSQFFAQKNITSVVEVEKELPLMYGDKNRIHQVFTNILSNAIKYSPENTTVTSSIKLDEKSFVITIRDEGMGIAPMEQDHIFSPFYEVNSTSNHTSSGSFLGGGTGLGLSIVKGVVQRHGGTIEVESEAATPEREYPGSAFIITLPQENSVRWSDDETQMMRLNTIMGQPIVKGDDVEEDDSETKKILIIDDDAEAVEICRVIFNKKYEILTSATGEVGLRIAFRERPQLILINFYLPGLSGTQVCRILKTQDETSHIPIAFFSAATQDKEVEQCYASGGDDFIVKPFSGKEITDKVNQLIAHGETPASLMGIKK